MLRTSGIKCRTTSGTHIPTAQVRFDRQLGTAAPTEYGFVLSLMLRPDLGWVAGKCVVTAYTSIKLVTALVLNGNDVPSGVPVSALCQGTDIQAMNWRPLRRMLVAVLSC